MRERAVGKSEKFHILVLHGPNLNLLGSREQAVYGNASLRSINTAIAKFAKREGISVAIRQSNVEGELVSWIQQAKERFHAIVINPAGLRNVLEGNMLHDRRGPPVEYLQARNVQASVLHRRRGVGTDLRLRPDRIPARDSGRNRPSKNRARSDIMVARRDCRRGRDIHS